ncbi:hypothetical protein GGF46_004516 [Coemansia sp. RSA 552]|nr:hypothetical protein GGF46_004516 [Coemansia sp. RSA 552]
MLKGRHCHGVAEHMRSQYRELRKCESQKSLEMLWGGILVHRLALQEVCEQFIASNPAAANNASADRRLWGIAYYDAIAECRKRLRLHTPLHNISHQSSLTGSSDGLGSQDGSLVRSSRTGSISEGSLEDWEREWWTMTLATLFNEALGYFQGLLRQMTTRLDKYALDYALGLIGTKASPPPPEFLIARRLYVYIGDIYRYQFMYLPLLTYGDLGPTNTAEILNLARWTYGRARAMYADNGRACSQLALLSAYSQNQFETVFWQMCGLCYTDRPISRSRSLLYIASPMDSVDSFDDPIEESVVDLARAVLGGDRGTVLVLSTRILQSLELDLAGIKETTTLLSLDSDFWPREYQLSVILAALLTTTPLLSVSEELRRTCQVTLQHLAMVLLLRQMLCLRQILEVGDGTVAETVYPLVSVCIWVDIWRSTPYLRICAEEQHQCPEVLSRAAELFDCFAYLIHEHSIIRLAKGSRPSPDTANTVLPHDVALLGWVSLRNVQQQLRYSDIDGRRLQAADPLSKLGTDICDMGLLDLWQNTKGVVQVVTTRIQDLVLKVAHQGMFDFLTWGSDTELHVGVPEPLLALPLESIESMRLVPVTSFGDRPLRVPDVDTWLNQLPVLQKWLLSKTYSIVLANSVAQTLRTLAKDNHQAQLALQFADDNVDGLGLLQATPEDRLDQWVDAEQYLYGLDEMGSIDELMLPTAGDIPENLQGLLSCVLFFAYVEYPSSEVAVVTDSEELQFYNSWFGIKTADAAAVI